MARWLGAARVWLPVLQSIVPHGLPVARPRHLDLLPGGSSDKFQRGSVPGSQSQCSQGLKAGGKEKFKKEEEDKGWVCCWRQEV